MTLPLDQIDIQENPQQSLQIALPTIVITKTTITKIGTTVTALLIRKKNKHSITRIRISVTTMAIKIMAIKTMATTITGTILDTIIMAIITVTTTDITMGITTDTTRATITSTKRNKFPGNAQLIKRITLMLIQILQKKQKDI
ncbi:MAG: hypothetical protein K0U86_03850 [Planctomycetes bacterium]|nr:hypothetical protein [Planctomycetota bacterium]MCH9724018.1 hypothetical protein [Planctomycetota bacterium]MCH9778074.1 hypothetical protein [Planctomycetota bacterium]